MSPYIRKNVLGHVPELPISDAQFDAVSQAHFVLAAAFALEESYDLLIGNYVEVEQELLTATASNAVRDLNEYNDFFELRSTINRRVVNLLTALAFTSTKLHNVYQLVPLSRIRLVPNSSSERTFITTPLSGEVALEIRTVR